MRPNHSSIVRRLRHLKAISISTLALAGATMLSPSARAAIITAGPYTATGTAGNASATVINTPTFDINSLAKTFTSVGPLDFSFPATPNGGTVTYLVTEGITNDTNQTWTDYHEQLGTGTGSAFVPGNTPVQFLLPTDTSYTNPAFPTRSVTASEIDYTGGAVVPLEAITLTFSITVPDSVTGGVYDFTLRQYPTVPEPTTLSLLSLGSIGLLARRRAIRTN
jgi:hypothetical protein